MVWNQSQLHVVSPNQNDLTIKYRDTLTDAVTEVSFTVPIGEYTTQELIDEMEDAIIANGLDEKGIMFEFTERGTCNLNLEGGEIIDAVGGGLSYLLYDMYSGGGFGALVGTTTFLSEYATLDIVRGQNDTMTFDIESFDGSGTRQVSLTIPEGSYTRSQLINLLNTELAGTNVTATEYGSGIKLAGSDSIVTGFKGNMFKIDPASGDVYHSVFYDNVSWGNVSMQPATFTGGYVKSLSSLSSEYAEFDITDSNNTLTFTANGADTPVTITIPKDTYTMDEMIDELNDLFAAEGLELIASDESNGSYERIKITSKVLGATSAIGLDKANSSAYDTLFVKRVYNQQVESPTKYADNKTDSLATVTGAKVFKVNDTLPLKITQGSNDTFKLKLTETNGTVTEYDITLDDGDYDTIDDIVDNINLKLQGQNLDGLVKAEISDSSTIKLTALTGSGLTGVNVSDTSGNTGYNDLFVKVTVTYTTITKTGTGSPPEIKLDTVLTDPMTFPAGKNTLDVMVNGAPITVTFPADTSMTRQEILDKINADLGAKPPVTTNNTFSQVNGQGTTTSHHFDRDKVGSTTMNAQSYSDTGYAEIVQGMVGGYDKNEPASITLKYAIPDYVDTTNGNNRLELTINGVEHIMVMTGKALVELPYP